MFKVCYPVSNRMLHGLDCTTDNWPLNDKTFKWINGSNYNFVSYVSNGNLIRHFIKSSLTEAYSGHYFTIIPINEKFFENIYWQQVQVDTHLAYIKHNFGFAMGKIVVLIYYIGMIEIYCRRKNLLVRAIGIILVAVSNDCSVNLNGQVRIMAQAQNVDTYFEPVVLLHKIYIDPKWKPSKQIDGDSSGGAIWVNWLCLVFY